MFTGSEIRENRLLFLDVARTIALFGMIVFHFFRNFEVFGMIAQGTTLNGGWAIFARAIAGSFLFLSGVSLVLAHARGFRGKAWLRRVVLISGAACLVTLATYAAFPSQFVFFGILHALAMASLLGVPFLFAPVWVSLIGAASILIASATVGRAVFTSPWMAWGTGHRWSGARGSGPSPPCISSRHHNAWRYGVGRTTFAFSAKERFMSGILKWPGYEAAEPGTVRRMAAVRSPWIFTHRWRSKRTFL